MTKSSDGMEVQVPASAGESGAPPAGATPAPSDSSVAIMISGARGVRELVAVLCKVRDRWESVAKHLEAGELGSALAAQQDANYVGAKGPIMSTALHLLLSEIALIDRPFFDAAVHAANDQIRAEVRADIHAKHGDDSREKLAANLESHRKICNDRDCPTLEALIAELAVLDHVAAEKREEVAARV